MEGISRFNQSNYNYPVGYGYITLPIGVDRDLYIKTCYRKERVAIQLDNGGGVINNCYISRKCIQDIKFPVSYEELGSCVAFICVKHNNLPMIIDIISKEDETQLMEENSFKKIVSTNNGIVSIEGKARTGELFINIDSEISNEGGLFITLRSKDNSSKFNVNCFGDVNIYSEGLITLKALNDVNLKRVFIDDGEEKISSELILSSGGFELRDINENYITTNKDGEIIIRPNKKCKLFGGGSPIPKGDELKKQLVLMKERIDSVIETLKAAQSASGSASSYAAAVTTGLNSISNVEDFSDMNSDKSFTD